MSTITVNHIAKALGSTQAVRDVSFEVLPGEIFGLLGPNGAGKTTIIRMILDIFKPDHGTISVFGAVAGQISANRDRIGYLPEERGLYKDARLEDCVLYLAELKGVARSEAKLRALRYFEQFDLMPHRKKKISELSKGMQQKVQIISTLIHQPALVIIDEPFSGLDPVNTRLVQEVLLREREHGTSIVMSTHQMYQVEEMCDRLVLINKGESVLYGAVNEVRRRYASHSVRVTAQGTLPTISGVTETERKGNTHTLKLPPNISSQEFLLILAAEPNLLIESYELAIPTMDDIFVRVVGRNDEIRN
jgi:ABC-2 type transport system ATP-binding protein